MKGGVLNILFVAFCREMCFSGSFLGCVWFEENWFATRSNVPVELKFVLLCVFTWLVFMNWPSVELFLATWSWFDPQMFGDWRCQTAFKHPRLKLNMKIQNIRVFEKDKRRSGLQLWHRVSLFLALKPQRKAHCRICDDLLHRLASLSPSSVTLSSSLWCDVGWLM